MALFLTGSVLSAQPFRLDLRIVAATVVADIARPPLAVAIVALIPIGDNALYRFAPTASDVPERSVQRVSPTAPGTIEGWPDHWPLPSLLLTPPEPVETVALLQDQPPSPSPGGRQAPRAAR